MSRKSALVRPHFLELDHVAAVVDGLEPDREAPQPLQVAQHPAGLVVQRAAAVLAMLDPQAPIGVTGEVDDLDVGQLVVAVVLQREQLADPPVAPVVVDAVDQQRVFCGVSATANRWNSRISRGDRYWAMKDSSL